MKLLLRHTVPNLGEAGEVVEISDGYGRNYLLPQRLAVPNTPDNRRAIEADKLRAIQREQERTDRAKAVGKSLKNALLQVHVKAQADGSLYGSVSRTVVVDVIKRSRGLEVEEGWVALENPIKKIGDYDLVLNLPGEQSVTFKLTVLPEE